MCGNPFASLVTLHLICSSWFWFAFSFRSVCSHCQTAHLFCHWSPKGMWEPEKKEGRSWATYTHFAVWSLNSDKPWMLALFIGLFHFRGKPLWGRLVANVAWQLQAPWHATQFVCQDSSVICYCYIESTNVSQQLEMTDSTVTTNIGSE